MLLLWVITRAAVVVQHRGQWQGFGAFFLAFVQHTALVWLQWLLQQVAAGDHHREESSVTLACAMLVSAQTPTGRMGVVVVVQGAAMEPNKPVPGLCCCL